MPSFFERIRALSQSTLAPSRSAPSFSTSTTTIRTPDASLVTPDVTSAEVIPQHQPQVDRKIHPDLNSLISSADFIGWRGLSPPRGRRRSAGDTGAIKPHIRQFRPVIAGMTSEAADESVFEEVEEGTETLASLPAFKLAAGSEREDADISSTKQNRSRLSRVLSVPVFSSSGEWSTFGRNKENETPTLADLGSRTPWRRSPVDGNGNPLVRRSSTGQKGLGVRKSASLRSSTGVRTNSTVPNSRSISAPRTPSRKSSDQLTGSQQHSTTSSPKNTLSSKKDKGPTTSTPYRSRSSTAQISQSLASRFARISTPIAKQLGFESPRTFGYPTPQANAASSRILASTETLPPLPPLSHPDIATFPESSHLPQQSSDTFVDATSNIEQSAVMSDQNSPELSQCMPSGALTLPNLPFTFGKSASSSRPAVKDLFIPPHHQDYSAPPSASTSDGSSGTKSRRRRSADWSAHQATAGVSADAKEHYGWPAEVSREMVLLSLERPATGKRRRPNSASSKPDSVTSSQLSHPRGENVVLARPDQPLVSETRRASLQPNSSPALGDPLVLSRSSPRTRSSLPSISRSSSLRFGRKRSSADLQAKSSDDSSFFFGWEWRRMQKGEGNNGAANGSGNRRIITPKNSKAPVNVVSPISTGSSARAGSTSLLELPQVSITAATPQPSPGRSTPPEGDRIAAGLKVPMPTSTPVSSDKSIGKRKAQDPEITPPDQKGSLRSTRFSLDPASPTTHRPSNASRAPTSYHRKRARLSTPLVTPDHSRSTTGSNERKGSRASSPASVAQLSHHPSRAASRAASTRPTSIRSVPTERSHTRNLSQTSIPLSAIISPRAPSVDRLSNFHMRDPRKTHIQTTGWSLHRRTSELEGSPTHAWFFFLGFLFPPLWWIAAFLPVPKTRHVGGTDTEKAVTLDDPQIEHDAMAWRFRCRVMSIVAFLTYIPFIVLVAVFVPR